MTIEMQELIAGVEEFKAHHVSELTKMKDEVVELEKKLNRRGLGLGGSGDGTPGETKEQRKHLERAYLALVAGDQQKANAAFLEYKNSMQVGNDAEGGYFVDPVRSQQMLRIMAEVAPFIGEANTINLRSGDAFEEVTDLNQAATSWVGENAARPDTNTPDIGKYRIELKELYSMPKLTQKLVDTADIDVIDWLNSKIAEAFAVAETTAFFTGGGIDRPKGFTQYDTAATADSSRAWETLEHVKTGVNGALGTTVDPLHDLVATLRPIYRPNARWVMSRSMANTVRKLKSGDGQYLWEPSLQAGQPDRLLGYPVLYAEEMPALATNSLSVAFGDFRKGYTIVRRPGIRLLVDPFTDKPNVRLYAYERVGGGVADFNAIKLLKFAA